MILMRSSIISKSNRPAKGKTWKALSVFLILFAFGKPLRAVAAGSSDYPLYIEQISNPNDYSLFANAGWDGNWYVGYNNGWIKKLPVIPQGHYARAFIGAKLGRMKTLPPVSRPPIFNPVPGEIWMGISSTASWAAYQRFELTSTDDIPFEASSEYALENTGDSEWFWTEVPLEAVHLDRDNFLALWSSTPELISISSAPVLAAAWGGKEVNTWIAKNIHGEPPTNSADAYENGSFLFPARLGA